MTLKDLEDALNLSKRYPNYFNKWIFRTVLILILILFLFIGFKLEWNFNNNNYFKCIKGICENPFCENKLTCDKPFFNEGESIGTPEPQLLRSFPSAVIMMLLGGFLLNHSVYLYNANKNKSNK